MGGPGLVLPLIVPVWVNAVVRSVLARGMTTTGGTGTAADARLVRAELERMPVGALQIMTNNKTKVVACRNDVVDALPHLATAHPRGYKPGATWTGVPGVFNGPTNQLVIATFGHGTAAGAHVPVTGEGHGAYSLVIHEAFHSIDGTGASSRSKEADFVAARDADKATLDSYEGQAGTPGERETYAESAARYYGGDPNDATNHPNLHDFWATHPIKP
jgi:hypothetical protein